MQAGSLSAEPPGKPLWEGELLNHEKHVVEEGDLEAEGVDLSIAGTEEKVRRQGRRRIEQHQCANVVTLI